MLRLVFGVSVLAALVLTYLVNPIVGWFALGTLFTFVLIKRSHRGANNGVAVRNTLRTLQ